MVENDKRDEHLLANSPLQLAKGSFCDKCVLSHGPLCARQAADSDSYETFQTRHYVRGYVTATVAQEWLSPLAAGTLSCGSATY
jgi:hypothetical protein